MGPDLRQWFPAVHWSWPTTLAVAGLASVLGSMALEASAAATLLLDGGIAAATIGVAAHVIGTWRVGHSL